jgi:hypothetical protein
MPAFLLLQINKVSPAHLGEFAGFLPLRQIIFALPTGGRGGKTGCLACQVSTSSGLTSRQSSWSSQIRAG